MSKLILTSRYLRDAPLEQLENYVCYIRTCDRVEIIDESRKKLPAAKGQKKLIQQMIRDIPEAKELLEYADFFVLLQYLMSDSDIEGIPARQEQAAEARDRTTQQNS